MLKLFGIQPGGYGGFSLAATAFASVHGTRQWNILYLESIDKQRDIFLRQDAPMFEFHWENTRQTLEAMQAFLEGKKIPLLLILAPAPVQMVTDLQDAYLSTI